jgi:hypothetical protein
MSPFDTGNYSCVALNQAGRETSATMIIVNAPPSIQLGATEINTDINEPARVSAINNFENEDLFFFGKIIFEENFVQS